MALPAVSYSTVTTLLGTRYEFFFAPPVGGYSRPDVPPAFLDNATGIITKVSADLPYPYISAGRILENLLTPQIVNSLHPYPFVLWEFYDNGFPAARDSQVRRATSNVDYLRPGEISCYLKKIDYYESNNQSQTPVDRPTYINLAIGYVLDTRLFPDEPTIVPTENKTVKIGYYQWNYLEKLPGLVSIDWVVYERELTKNISIKLPVKKCVFGTLHCSDIATKTAIQSLPTIANSYPYNNYFPEALPSIFTHWRALYAASAILDIPIGATNVVLTTETGRTLRVIGANNDRWLNRPLLSQTPDSNILQYHPMFDIDNTRAYNWHIAPQFDTDGKDKGRGVLEMDSIRTIEIHAALEAANNYKEVAEIIGTGTAANPQQAAKHTVFWYIKNVEKINTIWKVLGGDKFATYVDPATQVKVDRVSTLGWYVENIARVLGLRVDEKAYINSNEEEKTYTRTILTNPIYNKNAYSKNSFGRYGRLTPHLTNSNGLQAYDKVADIPQLLEAQFEHLNRSLGIQQGTEIEVLNSTTGKKDYYPNQLAMMLDIHSKITEIQLNAKENHNLLQVIAHEVRELFSGTGIPMSFKSLWTRYGEFMFVGHQSDRGSILTSLTTLKINVGMLVGNLLVDRPSDPRNPLERIFGKIKKQA